MKHSQTGIHISWAQAKDSDALVPLLRALYKHDVPQAREPTLDEVKEHVALLTAPETPHRMAVAWDQDHLAIGLAALALFVSVSDPRPDRWRQAELKELFVLPNCRGKGIGGALLDWVEQEAIASAACRLDWHVRSHNDRGLSFYQSHGASVVKNRLSMRKPLPLTSKPPL